MRPSDIIRRSLAAFFVFAFFSAAAEPSERLQPPLVFSDNRLILNYTDSSGSDIRAYHHGVELDGGECGGKACFILPDIVFVDPDRCISIRISDGGGDYDARIPFFGTAPVKVFIPFPEIEKGRAVPVIIESEQDRALLRVISDGVPKKLFASPGGAAFFYIVHPVNEADATHELTIAREGAVPADAVFHYKVTGHYPRERIDLPAAPSESHEMRELKALLLRTENKKIKMAVTDDGTGALSWDGSFIMPLSGRVTSAFGTVRSYNGNGYRDYHKGTDIGGNPPGVPVMASAPGTVVCAEEMYSRGGTVVIDHGAGIKTLYYHMSALCVRAGDEVEAGVTIGAVGSTGFSTGPHLHWELRVDGIPVSPEEALNGLFKVLFRI